MWVPFSGQNAENCANHSAQSQILKVFATGARFLVRKRLTNCRGTLVGALPRPLWRPSWAIVASEFRCDCPVQLPGSVDIWRSLFNLSRPFADQEKVFSVPLRAPPCPSVDQKVLRSSPFPSVDQKGVPPRPSRIKAALAHANTPRIKYPKSVTKKAPTGTPPLWSASTVKRKLSYFEPKPFLPVPVPTNAPPMRPPIHRLSLPNHSVTKPKNGSIPPSSLYNRRGAPSLHRRSSFIVEPLRSAAILAAIHPLNSRTERTSRRRRHRVELDSRNRRRTLRTLDLVERGDRLATDRRRRPHRHDLQPHRALRRRHLLLPDARPEHCR